MKKRLLNLFLVMLMVVCVLPMAANATSCKHTKNGTTTHVEAKAATCVESGNIEHWRCDICGKTYTEYSATSNTLQGPKNVSISATGEHNFTVFQSTTKSPTCTQAGEDVYKCESCDATETRAVEKLDHNITNDPNYLKETITAPTCQTPGRGKYSCSREGCTAWSKLDIPVVDCEAEAVAKVEPTCTAAGKTKGTSCKWCGTVMSGQKTIKALGHTEVEIAAVEPTCTAKGATAGVKCSVCDEVLTEPEEIAATGHHFTVFKDYNSDRAVRPTCETAGKARYGCEDCNAWSLQPVAAHGHKNWPKTKVEPTCTEPGREAGEQCEYCKEFTKGGTVIPATGVHDFSVWKANVTPATCTKREVEQYQCKTCTATENREVGNLLSSNGEHTPGKMVRYITRPTCQATGEAEYECTVCDETVKQVVRKLNCNIVDLAAKAPTCNNTGLTAGKTCTICDDTTKDQDCAYCAGIKVNQEVVKKLGHDLKLVETITPATCENAGRAKYQCSRCVYHPEKDIKALGHDYGEEILRDATCTRDGWKEISCSNEGCGICWTELIASNGHTEVAVPAVDATCTATGLTEGKKCSVCDETLVAQVVTDKLAHAWEAVEAQDPTCEEDGYSAHQACANCDETDGKTVIPASDAYHNFVNNKCTICEEYDPDHEHQGTGVVTTASTCTTEGVKTFECDGCDYAWTEAVAKAAHVYGADARCNACDVLNPDHRHTYVQTGYTAPTCTIAGKTTNRCSVCGDETETLIDATGHSYANGHCVNCGNPAACTHSETTTIKTPATCRRSGSEVITCDDCGATVSSKTIPVTSDHNYVNNYCTVCGKNDPSKITTDKQSVYIVG